MSPEVHVHHGLCAHSLGSSRDIQLSAWGPILFGEDSTGSLGLQEGLGKLGTCLC